MINESEPQFALFDPRSTLDDIAAQVSLIEEAVGVGKMPLAEDIVVQEWEGVTERRTAAAAARWMTGRREKSERQELIQAYDVRRRMIGALALDLAYRTFDQTGNTDKTKQAVLHYLERSQEEMVSLDYQQRLETSSVERTKEWIARHPLERLALPFAISAVGNGLVYRAMEMSSSFVDLSTAQERGVFGLMTIIGALAISSVQRNAPTQVGAVFRNRFNTSLKTYMLDGSDMKDHKKTPLTHDDLLEMYAERQLRLSTNETGTALLDYDVEGRDDLSPMIKHALDTAEESMYESYGIDREEPKGPWYRRVMGRLALAN